MYLFFRTPLMIEDAAFSGVTAMVWNRSTSFLISGSSRLRPTISTVSTSGVETPPGHTRETPIPWRRRSKRSTSEMPRSPNLLAL